MSGETGGRAKRDWSRIRNRASAVVAPWLGVIIAAYFIALNVPAPGLPGPIAWFLSAMESNPFRACHVEGVPQEPAVKKSSLFIRESYAQEQVVDPSQFQKGEIPNVANQPAQQQQQQQAPAQGTDVPLLWSLPLLPQGDAVDCEKQGFGDLIDVAMDGTGQRAWTINAHGLVYRTEDGGRSWQRQAFEALESGERLTNIAVSPDGQSLVITGQAANGNHLFYRSDDGGATWAFDPALEPGAIVGANGAVGGAMQGPIVGLTIGDKGSHILLVTGLSDASPWVWRSDLGRWQGGYDQVEPPMLKGWRTHNFGDVDISLSANGSTDIPILSWTQPFMTEINLNRVEVDPKDASGALTQVNAGAFDLSQQPSVPAMAAAASDTGTEIFLAGNGTILRGAEADDKWAVINVGALDATKPYVFAGIDVANGGRSIMAVGGNALFISHDGGATFFQPPLGRAPAPWFYVVLLAGPAFAFVRLKRPAGEVITVKGDKSNALSDRAQGLGGPDALNLKAYAEGIFDLLRNAGTEPPLVIGVTGPWGSGKSSVMLKLADLLKQQQMPTVWFNAWHHQSEDHLLASMLSNIRGQGIPKFWSKPGFRLRWRLLMRRLSSPSPLGAFLWSWFLLLLAALLIPGGLLLWTAYSVNLVPILGDSTQPIDWSGAASFVTGQFCDTDTNCGTLVKDVAAMLPSGKLGAIIAFLISLLSLDRLGRVALITRGFDPAKLMASMLPAGRNPKLDDQLSFRHRFGEELRSTAKALAPYRLVIFIDDLDRCRPENVVAVLEAVNFVVSEAECYVVIGMDRLYVLRGIRQQFAKFIEMEAVERKAGLTGALDADEGRPADFAEHYLEKLINMFVAVPKMDEPARERLMEQMVAADDQMASAPARFDWAARLRHVAAALLIGLVVVAPTWYLINKEPDTTNTAESQEPPPPTQLAIASGAAPGVAPSESAVVEVPLTTPRPEEVTPGRSAGIPVVDTAGLIGFAVIALVIVATIFVAVLRALAVPQDLLKHDTTAFRGELLNAEKSLAGYLTTPRRAKRFVNRLRLFASVLKTMLPTTPSPSGGKMPVDEDLDRQIVVAGTLHTLGREALAAKPEDQAPLRAKLAANMASIYQGASDKPMVDQLYWRFWGVADGVKPGDPIVTALAPANILKPPPEELHAAGEKAAE